MDDYVSLVTMMRRVMRLSLGAYLFRSPSLAAAAAAHLSTWFVHPTTAMRPSLANAQGIPGVTNGKATGAMDLFYAGRGWTDAVALLGATPEAAAAWPPRDAAAVRSWAAAMADYLTGAPQMRREAAMVNNHGVYWDLTVLALARLAGNATLAAAVTGPPGCPVGGGAPIVGCVPARLAAQVDAAGAQVAELGRAFPGHYVWYTLMAHAHLAALASSTSGRRAHPSGGTNNTIPLPLSPHPVSAVTPALVAAAAWAAPHATAPPGVPIDGGYGYAAAAYRLVARLTGDPASAAVACNVLGIRAARGGDAALWDDGGVITAVVALALPPPAGAAGCAVWEAGGQQQRWAEPGGGRRRCCLGYRRTGGFSRRCCPGRQRPRRRWDPPFCCGEAGGPGDSCGGGAVVGWAVRRRRRGGRRCRRCHCRRGGGWGNCARGGSPTAGEQATGAPATGRADLTDLAVGRGVPRGRRPCGVARQSPLMACVALRTLPLRHTGPQPLPRHSEP